MVNVLMIVVPGRGFILSGVGMRAGVAAIVSGRVSQSKTCWWRNWPAWRHHKSLHVIEDLPGSTICPRCGVAWVVVGRPLIIVMRELNRIALFPILIVRNGLHYRQEAVVFSVLRPGAVARTIIRGLHDGCHCHPSVGANISTVVGQGSGIRGR